MQQRRESNERSQTHAQEHPELVARVPRNTESYHHERSVEQQVHRDTNKAPLLTDRAENEIRICVGKVPELLQALTQAGAVLLKIIGIIDRQEGGSQNIADAGYNYEPLFTRAELGI